MMQSFLKPTPWNSRAIHMECYEITEASDDALRGMVPELAPGHYTVRIDPLAKKRVLHELGFYYCDTAVEYYCRPQMLVDHLRDDVELVTSAPLEKLIAIAGGSFSHSHFHRDYRIPREDADRRFTMWVEDIHASGNYYALLHHGEVAGFFAYSGSAIILQVNAAKFRGKGLGKPFWTLCCRARFAEGHEVLTSPVSSCNIPINNLHIDMGFKIHHVEDIYHLVVEGTDR